MQALRSYGGFMALSVSEIPHIAGRAFLFFGLVSEGLVQHSVDMFSNIEYDGPEIQKV